MRKPLLFLVSCLLRYATASSEQRSFHIISTATKTDKTGYRELYECYLGPRRHQAIRLLEVGLGCTMPYGPGASLQVRTLCVHSARRRPLLQLLDACLV